MNKLMPTFIFSLSLALILGACLQPRRGTTPPTNQPSGADKTAMAPANTGTATGRRTTAKDFSRYLKVHQGRFIRCFESAKQKDPSLAGTVRLEGMLYPDGSIKNAMINQGTLKDAKARLCMIGELSNITLPEAKVELPTRVVFPLQFGM